MRLSEHLKRRFKGTYASYTLESEMETSKTTIFGHNENFVCYKTFKLKSTCGKRVAQNELLEDVSSGSQHLVVRVGEGVRINTKGAPETFI